jgi:phosphoribosylformimino-5-aminoimidazole carboxamide ribotide isomerase
MRADGKRTVRVIPVVDVLRGQVVRAVGGRREEYRPIQSALAKTAELPDVAAALLKATNAAELYIADLDAILGGPPSAVVEQFLSASACRVLLDQGIREFAELSALECFPQVRMVLASETLRTLPPQFRPCDVFSLDLLSGVPRGAIAAGLSAVELARRVVDRGCGSLIVLDVTAVGERGGPRTLELVREVRAACPAVEIISGGGIRNRDDVGKFAEAGCDAVLVSTALHDGTL